MVRDYVGINADNLQRYKMVYVLVKIKEDIESLKQIKEFDENIFSKQVSNVMFRDDSFIRFVNPDTVLVYLNTIAPKEIPFYLTVLSLVIGFVFHIYVLIGVGGFLAVLYYSFSDVVFHLFKLGLRKRGFKGKIEAL